MQCPFFKNKTTICKPMIEGKRNGDVDTDALTCFLWHLEHQYCTHKHETCHPFFMLERREKERRERAWRIA